MTTRWPSAAATLLAALSLVAAVPATAQEPGPTGKPFRIALTGAAETGPGDPDGSGTAELRINPGTGEVCFIISVENVDVPTAAHIHEGAVGVSGGVVVNLNVPENGLSGCVSADRDVLVEILANPSKYYVNVHNGAHPDGAVRGQLAH